MKRFFPFIALAAVTVLSVFSCQQEPEEIRVSSISLSKSALELTVGDQASLDATISPDNATNKKISWRSSKESVATVTPDGIVEAVSVGTAFITATSEDSGVNAKCEITVKEKENTTPARPTPSGSVDLGLSVKWASCNLGASKPTECGGYYQWAGTKDVSDTSIYLDWRNCPYHTGTDTNSGWMKYNTKSSYGTVDNKTVLESMDDAASVALGGKWRMPTNDEWKELCNTDNCSWTWTTIDGVNGFKVQSKKSGYTDNWIFLPAAGYRIGGSLDGVGSDAYYWSSSLYKDSPRSAYYMLFLSGNCTRDSVGRYNGHSIRPVSE